MNFQKQELNRERTRENNSNKPNLLRRLYNWVLSLSQSKYSSWFLFILAFVESSFFLIPPDVLLIALVLGDRSKWLKFAVICTVGSVLGGLFGYFIGYYFMESVGVKIIDFYHAQEMFKQVENWYKSYGVSAVFIAAFTPIPYKVFTIASGVFELSVIKFFLASLVGRGARFFLVSLLLKLYGEPMKKLIDKYFDLLAILFVVLLALGFIAVSYF